jgi:hypothetical protein
MYPTAPSVASNPRTVGIPNRWRVKLRVHWVVIRWGVKLRVHWVVIRWRAQLMSEIDDVSNDVRTVRLKRWRVKRRVHMVILLAMFAADARRRAPTSWCTYVETWRTGPILARERERRSWSFVQNVGDGVVPAEARGCKILLGNFFSHLAVWSVFLGNNWELILQSSSVWNREVKWV